MRSTRPILWMVLLATLLVFTAAHPVPRQALTKRDTVSPTPETATEGAKTAPTENRFLNRFRRPFYAANAFQKGIVEKVNNGINTVRDGPRNFAQNVNNKVSSIRDRTTSLFDKTKSNVQDFQIRVKDRIIAKANGVKYGTSRFVDTARNQWNKFITPSRQLRWARIQAMYAAGRPVQTYGKAESQTPKGNVGRISSTTQRFDSGTQYLRKGFNTATKSMSNLYNKGIQNFQNLGQRFKSPPPQTPVFQVAPPEEAATTVTKDAGGVWGWLKNSVGHIHL